MSTARVTIVQPHLTAYRLPVYTRLTAELAHRGIELAVAHGRAAGGAADRRDSVRMPGAVELPQRDWRIAGRHVVWRDLGGLARRCDAVILTQSLHQLDGYPLLVRRRRRGAQGRARIGLWGHGRTYTTHHGPVQRHLKAALTRRADWFFAYTEGGGRYAASVGVPPQRVTVLHNALDTTSLAALRNAVTDDELRELRLRHGLVRGRTALYIGGLDPLKRVPFLLAAARDIADRVPGFRLLVAGDGAQRALVERFGPPVVYTGRADDRDKALLGAASDVMLVPGAVGLAAVDSFALRTPLVTTSWPYHGPEFEYLQDGRNALVAPDDPAAYAEAVAGLLVRRSPLVCLARSCRADAARYTVESMAARFADGIEGLINVST